MLDSVVENDRVETRFMLNCGAGGTPARKNLYFLFSTTWQITDKNAHSVLMARRLRVVAGWKKAFSVLVAHPKQDRSHN